MKKTNKLELQFFISFPSILGFSFPRHPPAPVYCFVSRPERWNIPSFSKKFSIILTDRTLMTIPSSGELSLEMFLVSSWSSFLHSTLFHPPQLLISYKWQNYLTLTLSCKDFLRQVIAWCLNNCFDIIIKNPLC